MTSFRNLATSADHFLQGFLKTKCNHHSIIRSWQLIGLNGLKPQSRFPRAQCDI